MKLFAVSQPGIEEITEKELKELGIECKAVPGGVEFEGGLREVYLSNLWLRSASRVLVRLCYFRAKHFGELVRKAKKCPWEEFITRELPVKVRATSKRSKLYHTTAVKERILKAMELSLGFKPKLTDYEDEGTSVIVRIENDTCTISVNSSGALLHKRGYRVREVEAPIRENLAAAMVLASGWRGEEPLVDPFCGSGTIPIEAALIASNTPPGLKRDFAFTKWKNFKRELWKSLKEEAVKGIKEVKFPIVGFDIDPLAVEAAKENAKAAGVSKWVQFKNLSFPRLNFERATVITNPPYGVRLNYARVKQLFRELGNWTERNFKSYKLLFLSPKRELAKLVSEKAEMITYFDNGGIKVGLYLVEKV
ncbi:THUMP domain-containing class I SAM-dependent RNA methyltransferase [Thermovibrio sp.]